MHSHHEKINFDIILSFPEKLNLEITHAVCVNSYTLIYHLQSL